MARSIDNDFLQDYRFHLFDVSPNILGLYTFALTPTVAFMSISAPSLVLEKGTIRPGNSFYPHKYVKYGVQNTIVLQRGASLTDGDFWRWYQAHLTGDPGSVTTIPATRRTFILAHFSTKSSGSNLASFNRIRNKSIAQVQGGTAVISAVQAASVVGLLGTIPCRAWMLHDCQPAGYKGASDLVADSSSISIREMGLDYSGIDEINMGGV